MAKKPNPLKEEFAIFLEAPSRDSLRNVLKNNLGESDQIDFKREWPDDAKLAKHALALANSGGGCLVIGVEEINGSNLVPSGLQTLREKAEVDQSLRRFLPESLAGSVLVMNFQYEESEYPRLKGKSFQVVSIPDFPEDIPFLATSETSGLRRNAVFVRRMASTVEATYEELQRIISRRIETQHSSSPALELSKHLADLRLLHGELDRFHMQHPFGNVYTMMLSKRPTVLVEGKLLRVEPYEEFLARAIVAKQKTVAELLRA